MLTAVILAAGEGSRMGTLKQLLPWGESTILEAVLGNVARCDYIDDEIRVVIGAEAERVKPVLAKWNEPRLRVLENPGYKAGMLTTIRKGLENLPERTEAVMLVLGDQPLIGSDIFDIMAEEFLSLKPEIMVPSYSGRRGHPLILSRALLPEVDKLSGPGGLRSLLWKYPEKIHYREIGDRSVMIDLDYIEEYQKYRREYEEK